MRLKVAAVALGLIGACPVWAQDQTLADIRQDLTTLNIEIQRLKREMSTTSASQVAVQGDVLTRISSIERELQRLTGQTEALEFRIGRIVADGTNRIGDLEFRLVELEGGDVSQLGQTSTLGGAAAVAAPAAPAPPLSGSQLAVSEQGDFDAAMAHLEAGDHAAAVSGFRRFRDVYPGSPLEPQALLNLGFALEAAGDTKGAARAYLDSYSGFPQSIVAGQALYRVGTALALLGKPAEACVTLAEVDVRFPGSDAAREAQAAMQAMACN